MPCKIPFTIDDTQYYHCTKDSQCETESGTARCNGIEIKIKIN